MDLIVKRSGLINGKYSVTGIKTVKLDSGLLNILTDLAVVLVATN